MIALLALIGLQATMATPTPVPAAPSPVVERVVRFPRKEESYRITLFDNRVAVASRSEHGRQALVRKRRLTEASYVGYVAAIGSDRQVLARLGRDSSTLEGGGLGEITVYGPGDDRTVIRYHVMGSQPLPLARLVAMLDDLQRVVFDTNPAHDALTEWAPKPGDRVRMVTGQTATVTRAEEDGTVFVVYDDVGIVELVTPAQRSDRIIELIGPSP